MKDNQEELRNNENKSTIYSIYLTVLDFNDARERSSVRLLTPSDSAALACVPQCIRASTYFLCVFVAYCNNDL